MAARPALCAALGLALLVLLLSPSRALASRGPSGSRDRVPGDRVPGDRPNPATAWNAVALDVIRSDNVPPPAASRLLAILHAAIHAAVDEAAGAPPGETPYAAAVAAGHAALAALAPGELARLDSARDALRAAAAPWSEAGAARGAAAAASVLAERADDGAAVAAGSAPVYGSDAPGAWRGLVVDGAQVPGLLPLWGRVRPFSMTSAKAAALAADVAPPPAPGSPAHAAMLAEVVALGGAASSARSADETELAHFWADGGGTATPPGHWNEIAARALAARGADLPEAARALALLNAALADAAIIAWAVKYEHSFWRPVSAAGGGWAPLLKTPPFPEHVSGHSTFSAAAAAVLAGALGDGPFECGSDGLAGVTRAFPSFAAAAAESGFSRICGGIHFSTGNAEGLALGRAIGEHVLRTQMRRGRDGKPRTAL
jgi:hypothetical protein